MRADPAVVETVRDVVAAIGKKPVVMKRFIPGESPPVGASSATMDSMPAQGRASKSVQAISTGADGARKI